jgi:deoxyribonuclease V
MALPGGHDFPTTAPEARRLVRELAVRVIVEDRFGDIRVIGGADASATRFDPTRAVHAAIVALDVPALTPLGEACATSRGGLPYIPGLLGFREVPALAAAWQCLHPKPDLLLVDGHGLAHPKGLGVASLLGLVLDVPTIGVAKSLLVGEVVGEAVMWRGARIGSVLPTRRGARPIYVSVGHRVSLVTAEAWVRRCLRGRRLPEPTRLAHLAAAAERLRAGPAGV